MTAVVAVAVAHEAAVEVLHDYIEAVVVAVVALCIRPVDDDPTEGQWYCIALENLIEIVAAELCVYTAVVVRNHLFFAVDYFRTRQVGPKPEYPSCAVGLAPTDEHDGVVHMNFDA
eukprot:CAMPEP_0201270388 /NCGR_PEP_ID=MMETSP0853-20130426/35350_1 /ASSEMBLY_ACC=CAM_ASM_000640 /TAXON_ID=183588 /ORGANISM="Pseudo-nitzschia fraudulenta, Strain WWA7" /LENGTH=115 /DNA_ID=CAMNT_0047576647 /DNA_START=254 /DNA_END=601 /DNA_ORIENTATION=-